MIHSLPAYLDAELAPRAEPLDQRRRRRPSSDRGPDVTEPLAVALEAARRRNRAELGLAGLAGASVLASSVRSMTLRSALLPTFTYRPGRAGQAAQTDAGGGGLGRAFLRWLQPQLDLDTELGSASWAPEGRPTRNYWPLVALAAAAAGGGLLYVLARGLAALARDLRRPR